MSLEKHKIFCRGMVSNPPEIKGISTRNHHKPISRSVQLPHQTMTNTLKLRIRQIFWLGMSLYAISTLILLGLHFLIGERWEMVALLNSFIHLLLLPAFIGIIITTLTRRWRTTLMFIPTIMIMLIWYGAFFMPRTQSAPESAPILSVMSYNIWQGDRAHWTDKAEMILASDADIIAVQELDTESAEFLADALGDAYPYQALHHFPRSATGQGVFSRYPILDDEFWRLYRGQQRVVIDMNGLEVVLYNLRGHPPLRADGFVGREREVTAWLARLTTEDETVPLIIAGDFNMTDRSDDYGRITEYYDDAFREVGFGFGWTFNASLPIPLLRIDYLFHNDVVQALEARVIQNSAGSDHNPLIVNLALLIDP